MKIYLVGGAVRDGLLELEVQERDYVVVGATEDDMLSRGFKRMDVDFPVFQHPDTGDEYALARRETKTGPGYKGFSVYAGPDVSLEEDLARRDLTINALAQDEDGQIVDPFDGLKDLQEGFFRHITPAFVEDPVRLLRAARFSAKLGPYGFRLSHKTFKLLKQMAAQDELQSVFPDRFRQEMGKALKLAQPCRFFETLQSCGALQSLLPLLSAQMSADTAHGERVSSESMTVMKRLASATPDPALRFAGLMARVLDGSEDAMHDLQQLSPTAAGREILGYALDWPVERVLQADADELMAFFAAIQLFHHPQRLDSLAVIWRALQPELGEAAWKRASAALRAAAQVKAAQLSKQGFGGPQLGAAIRQQRREVIERTINVA